MSEKMTFKEINKIDVSEHTEQKMNLTYLSWAWAHAEMKKIDENAEIKIHEFPDTDALVALASHGVPITPGLAETITASYKKDKAGAYVKVSVTLNGRTETEYLPVMDFKNKAMANPDAMAINKAHKRCFVKALALHGLGLYIYAGEDLPEPQAPATITKTQVSTIRKVIKSIADLTAQTPEQAEKNLLETAKVQGSLEDLDENQFGNFLNFLNQARAHYEKVEEKKRTQKAEQTSLMDGNTTTPKGDK